MKDSHHAMHPRPSADQDRHASASSGFVLDAITSRENLNANQTRFPISAAQQRSKHRRQPTSAGELSSHPLMRYIGRRSVDRVVTTNSPYTRENSRVQQIMKQQQQLRGAAPAPAPPHTTSQHGHVASAAAAAAAATMQHHYRTSGFDGDTSVSVLATAMAARARLRAAKQALLIDRFGGTGGVISPTLLRAVGADPPSCSTDALVSHVAASAGGAAASAAVSAAAAHATRAVQSQIAGYAAASTERVTSHIAERDRPLSAGPLSRQRLSTASTTSSSVPSAGGVPAPASASHAALPFSHSASSLLPAVGPAVGELQRKREGQGGGALAEAERASTRKESGGGVARVRAGSRRSADSSGARERGGGGGGAAAAAPSVDGISGASVPAATAPPAAASAPAASSRKPGGGGTSSDSLVPYGYSTQSPIAAGAFSTIVRARHISSGAEFAVKTFATRIKGGKQPADLDGIKKEIEALKTLQPSRHAHIANLVETFETDYELHAILEYCSGGSVKHRLNSLVHGVGLSEADASNLTAQVGCALAHMHALSVTHRDIKPDNVIFTNRSRAAVRVVDFGFARMSEVASGRLRTVCGSPAYMAPEILSGKPYLGPPVDVWALGNFVYELLHSKPAFRAESIAQLNMRIRKANHAQYNPNVSKKAQAIIKKGLTVDVGERPEAAALTRQMIDVYQLKGTEAMAALME